jgi:hypothetical protein
MTAKLADSGTNPRARPLDPEPRGCGVPGRIEEPQPRWFIAYASMIAIALICISILLLWQHKPV